MNSPPVPVLLRVASGDSAALAECVERYSGLVWALARRYLGASADAEDAVQEIFFELWRSAARYSPALSSEAGFVALIARRRLIDLKRRAARRPAVVMKSEPSQDASAELRAEAGLLQRALAQLKQEQRHVLLLATCHGLSHEEIAQQTGMPLGTVKTHARRGLIRVREILNAERGVKV